MRYRRYVSFLIVILFQVNAISASPCGKDGATVVKAFSGDAFVIYAFRKGTDVVFQLPGKNISFPDGTTKPKRFVIDGLFFESLFAETKDFLGSIKGMADADVLKKHRDYEINYIKKTGTPLTEFVDIGPRERPKINEQPSFTFYLWKMIDPKEPNGTQQYYLTTVSDGQIAVFSAIVPDASMENSAMRVFQAYAGSFQHILRKDQCPESKSN